MDISQLRKRAEKLKEILDSLAATDSTVSALRQSLMPYIRDAIAGSIAKPIESSEIPGTYAFQESDLRKYRDLEQAYAEFKIEISGGKARWGGVLATIRGIKASPQQN